MFDKKLIDFIGKELLNNNESVAIAESVTGGLLQAAFSIAKDNFK
jgi:nicotinamide mononucleotide (NMN) deamidase PncC